MKHPIFLHLKMRMWTPKDPSDRMQKRTKLYRNLYLCFCFVLFIYFFFSVRIKKKDLGLTVTECWLFIHKKDASLGHESLHGGGIPEDGDMNRTTEQSSFIQEICRANDNAV